MKPTLAKRIMVVVAVLFAAVAPTHAAQVTCDFEAGTLCGWLSSTTGGTGSTGVELHNASNQAFAQQTGSGIHALTRDFAYVATDVLSFDMHAVANPGGFGLNSLSGVRISFLNALNVTLGTLGIYNVTATSLLGTNDVGVDNVPHNYAQPAGTFAQLAGLSPGASPAKISVTFIASANSCNICGPSASKVWFDNFSLAPVPEPGSAAMLLAGLLFVAVLRSRRVGSRSSLGRSEIGAR